MKVDRMDLWELFGTLAPAILIILLLAFLIMGADSLDQIVFGK